MSEFDDLRLGPEDDEDDHELVVDRELEETVSMATLPDERRSSAIWWVLAAFALVAVAAWWWLRRPPEAPVVAERSPAVAPVEAEPEEPLGPSEEELDPLEIPGLDASDEVVRELVSRLSKNPRLAEWLATDRLVRRFVVSVVNVAEGVHPRKHLPVRNVDGAFEVDTVGGGQYPDPTSYDRYRPLVAVFTSIDPAGAAELYGRLRPLLNEAYRDLGYPRGSFDDAMRGALRRIAAAPIPDSPPPLKRGVGDWEYEDPRFESLSPVEKQLLRLGPTLQSQVRSQARRLGRELGMDDL